MRHTISVEVAYLHRASARGLPPSHTRPRPTPGRTPHPAPTSLSHPRNRSPRGGPYASGRTYSTPTSTPAEPATHRTEAINASHRTRKTSRQRLPQPHQLPTPNAPHRRRPRRLHPHPPLKSQSIAYVQRERLLVLHLYAKYVSELAIEGEGLL